MDREDIRNIPIQVGQDTMGKNRSLFKISMDINRVNNSETTDPDRLPLRRLFHKLTLFIQACLGFMLL